MVLLFIEFLFYSPSTRRGEEGLLQRDTAVALADNTTALLRVEVEVAFLHLELLRLNQSLELFLKYFEEINTYKERKVES